MNTHHSGLNKFSSEQDDNFNLFLNELKPIVEHAVFQNQQHRFTALQPINMIEAATSQRIIDSMRFSLMNARYASIQDPHSGTFNWIFNEKNGKWDSLTEFLSGNQQLYWIHGKPGSGKSSLMKFLCTAPQTSVALRHLVRNLGQKSDCSVVLRHFFWLSGTEDQRSGKGLWASLLNQLLDHQQELLCLLTSKLPEIQRKRDFDDWSLKELREALEIAIEISGSYFCIFIDGVDEINQPEALHILEHIRILGMDKNVKICISSRPEPRFQRMLQSLPQLKLQDLTADDIRKYSTDVLSHAHETTSLSPIVPSQLDCLVNLILLKAEGVFIWVLRLEVSFRGYGGCG